MNPLIYAAALVGFLAGSFGYVLTRFVLLPIGRYRRIKRNVSAVLGRVSGALEAPQDMGRQPPLDPDTALRVRQLSERLSDCFTGQLPHWYRLHILHRRKESPVEAAKQLMALSNTRNRGHAARQVQRIRKCLGLKQA